ncbi:hypothetical protein Dimus_028231 [Dionaea muscipula]
MYYVIESYFVYTCDFCGCVSIHSHTLLFINVCESYISDSASKLFNPEMLDARKWGLRLDSGSLTPDALGLSSRDSLSLENQILKLESLGNPETESLTEENLADH